MRESEAEQSRGGRAMGQGRGRSSRRGRSAPAGAPGRTAAAATGSQASEASARGPRGTRRHWRRGSRRGRVAAGSRLQRQQTRQPSPPCPAGRLCTLALGLLSKSVSWSPPTNQRPGLPLSECAESPSSRRVKASAKSPACGVARAPRGRQWSKRTTMAGWRARRGQRGPYSA